VTQRSTPCFFAISLTTSIDPFVEDKILKIVLTREEREISSHISSMEKLYLMVKDGLFSEERKRQITLKSGTLLQVNALYLKIQP
jgi:hypothetical protein